MDPKSEHVVKFPAMESSLICSSSLTSHKNVNFSLFKLIMNGLWVQHRHTSSIVRHGILQVELCVRWCPHSACSRFPILLPAIHSFPPPYYSKLCPYRNSVVMATTPPSRFVLVQTKGKLPPMDQTVFTGNFRTKTHYSATVYGIRNYCASKYLVWNS